MVSDKVVSQLGFTTWCVRGICLVREGAIVLSKIIKASLPIGKERACMDHGLTQVDLSRELTFPSIAPQVHRLNTTGSLFIIIARAPYWGLFSMLLASELLYLGLLNRILSHLNCELSWVWSPSVRAWKVNGTHSQSSG